VTVDSSAGTAPVDRSAGCGSGERRVICGLQCGVPATPNSRRPFRFAAQCIGARTVRDWRERARLVENLGYSTAYCPDHFGDQWAPTIAMTVAAEATTTLTVGAMVFAADYRHPAVLAKEMATLDLVSEGRLEVGLGAGWMLTDYQRSGIALDPPGRRIERLAEAVAVCRGLWSDGPFDFQGRHYRIAELAGTPAPHRPGGPPIVIGGGGRRVLTLAARQADIVGLNASLHDGALGAGVAQSARAERFDERRRWVEEACGAQRFAELELQLNTFLVRVTATSAEAGHLFDTLAGGFGLTPDQARDTPMVLVGTVEDICDQLVARRERYATSYIVVHEHELEAFAPVVARLAGT
jgi:probable F420-dependent oxidoreductase